MLAAATGGPKFGFPAGPEGLKHRFFQGYLLPAYTGSMVTEFRSEAAVEAWEDVPHALAVHEPRLDRLRLHAGAAPDRGGLGRLGPHRAPRRRLQRSARTTSWPSPRPPGPRAAPSCRWSPAWRCRRPRPTWRPRKALIAYMLQPDDPGRDAPRDQLLPGGRRGAARRHARLGAAVRRRDRRHDHRRGRAAGAAAGRARRSRRPVQPGLHRHLRAHRARRAGHPARCSTSRARRSPACSRRPARPAGRPTRRRKGPARWTEPRPGAPRRPPEAPAMTRALPYLLLLPATAFLASSSSIPSCWSRSSR